MTMVALISPLSESFIKTVTPIGVMISAVVLNSPLTVADMIISWK